MHQIHLNTRTTPAVRAEITCSTKPSGTLAGRFGVSIETIRKWRKAAPKTASITPPSRTACPGKPPRRSARWSARCVRVQSTNFALDDLTFVVTHFLPHLDHDSLWRIFRAEGLNRQRALASERTARGTGQFRDYELGFIYIDIKQLPKLQTATGERHKRYLYVAID